MTFVVIEKDSRIGYGKDMHSDKNTSFKSRWFQSIVHTSFENFRFLLLVPYSIWF